MGDKQNGPFQLSFNASLEVDFQGSRVTSDGGLILVRELDERLGLGDLIVEHLTDSRRGKNTQLPLANLLRQPAYSRMAGYEDVNDADYHPLLLFKREGDCVAAKLRPGNVHSADDWEELLLPEIERQQKLGKEVVFRADAAFAKPEIYERLETRGVKYAIRIPSNENLERDIAELLTRPVGRPSYKPVVWYKSFLYQAASWKTARRVVAKVEFHFGELFPRVGFIVTNLEMDSRAVVRFYNKRGTAEQWIREGKQAVKMTRLSCHRFRSNEVRLWLSVIAYNLGNLWRRLVLPKKIDRWSLTSLQQRLVKTGGRLVKHARYYWLLLAEGHLTRRLFGAILRTIWVLPLPTGQDRAAEKETG
ncbi:MAG: IS1380 family transposase [Bryobacteraceae bacterium]|jgi:hypothetical protein